MKGRDDFLKKLGVRTYTGFIWLKMWSIVGLLNTVMNIQYNVIKNICWVKIRQLTHALKYHYTYSGPIKSEEVFISWATINFSVRRPVSRNWSNNLSEFCVLFLG